MLLFGHDDAVAKWVGEKVGKPFHHPYTAIGILNGDGLLIGGAVFTGHTGDGIELSVAGKGVISRGFFAAIHDYVFRQLQCVRLSIHTSMKNKRVKKMAPNFGFQYEGVERRKYGSQDGVRYSITIDDLPALRSRWRF